LDTGEAELGAVGKKKFTCREIGRRKGDTRMVKRKAKKGQRDAEE